MNADKLMERRGWRFDHCSQSWDAVRFGFRVFVADYGAFVYFGDTCVAFERGDGLLDNAKLAEESARKLRWVQLSDERKQAAERIRSGR